MRPTRWWRRRVGCLIISAAHGPFFGI